VKSDHQRDAYVEDLSVIVISAKSAWRQVRFGGWLSAQAGCQEREENLTLLTRDGIA
jgi:hypothetical protein